MNQILGTGDIVEHTELLFRKFAYSRYDVKFVPDILELTKQWTWG
jgi:hypothetical protein